MKFVKLFNILILLSFCMSSLSACSTVVGGTAVFLVSKHSEKKERDNRRYKRINQCFIKGEPEAFRVAESIAHGAAINAEYQIILNPEMKSSEPSPPHHIAYAFYVIAEKIGDTRGKRGKEWIFPYMKKEEAEMVEEFIDKKYLTSFLSKCFSVPKEYHQSFSRDVIGGINYRTSVFY